MSGSVEIHDLRRWLLYWDEITYTGIEIGGGMISGIHPQDVLFLEAEGVFKTEFVDIQSLDLTCLPPPVPGIEILGLAGNQFVVAAAAARVQLSQQLSESTGNIWTIGQSGGESLLLPGASGSAKLIDVRLVNCLPVPVQGTPFEDILRFKSRYQDELDELRRALDQLRENILSSSDERRVTDAAINQISRAISDIRAALRSAVITEVSETIDLYTKNPSIGFWAAMGGVAAAGAGIPFEVGVGPGLAGSVLCKFLQRLIVGGQSLPKNNPDFVYVYEAIKQLNM